MPILDIILLLVVLGAVVLGYRKGIVEQLGSIGGLILGFITARLLGPWCSGVIGMISRHMAENPEPTMFDLAVGYTLMFILGYMVARVVAHFFHDLTKALKLGFLDRIGGLVWTVFEWVFIFSLVLNLWHAIRPTNFSELSMIAQGRLIDFVYHLAPNILGFAAY